MIVSEDFFFFAVMVLLAIGLILLVNVVYFQVMYQRKVDRAIHGDECIDGSWIFNSTRMMVYAHYCLFSARAIKAGVAGKIVTIPFVIKAHLVLHWLLVIGGSLLMVVLILLDHFYLHYL